MTMPNLANGAIPKGKAVLLTGGYDHTIRFWEVNSGLSFRTMQYPDSVCQGTCMWL
jgi:WD40 repeat protein